MLAERQFTAYCGKKGQLSFLSAFDVVALRRLRMRLGGIGDTPRRDK
jgi:hypothetical protein